MPTRKMPIDCHACKTINEGPRRKHYMIQIKTFDKLAPFARLGKQINHPLPDCSVLGPQAFGCLEINKRAGVDDLEMRRVIECPLQISTTHLFQRGNRLIRIGV